MKPTLAPALAAVALLALPACGSDSTPSAQSSSTGSPAAAAPSTIPNPPLPPTAPPAEEADGVAPGASEGPVQALAGQSVTLSPGVMMTVTWGAVDPNMFVSGQPKGGTWVTFTVKNTSAVDLMDGDVSFVGMTAGDELRTVSGVAAEGAGSWPKRIKAGKTATWKECFLATEKEQRVEVQPRYAGAEPKRVVWVRK